MNAPATDRSCLREKRAVHNASVFHVLQRSILETIRSQAAQLQAAACTATVYLNFSSCRETGLCRHRPKAAAIVS